MKKIAFIIILLASIALFANLELWPRTNVVEAFVAQDDPSSNIALQSLDQALQAWHEGEFTQARLYQSLGDAGVQARFSQNPGGEIPSVVFNGSHIVQNPSDLLQYSTLAQQLMWASAPIRMEITQFNPASGATSVKVTLLNPEQAANGLSLWFYLLENNSGSITRVARSLHNQNITLNLGEPAVFSHNFSIDQAWNQSNLWVLATIQDSQGNIIQATTSLEQPEYQVRAVLDWDPANLVFPPNSSGLSEILWVFNTGQHTDTMTMQIVEDESSPGWYFNYCDEENNCYPGSIPQTLILAPGEAKAFHLNLWVAEGFANFHFAISSPDLGTYEIPFHATAGTAVSDNVLPPNLLLGVNSPNPFRAETSIRVNALKNENVTIQIFDVKGRLVDETPVFSLRAGENHIQWQAPSGLSSGVYYYRLEGSSEPPRRMLLLK
ncbi:MAG: T9SS type A sorting domain-containing protein [Candidatus Cloacimonadaceae bacterium]|jgi:hypothetical protein|nr:T9SS type A sorting domain-containing protein [Candidatus Cloacimonadota bacterium]MDX9949511.1 T9SS type A sorting domain-containing protein [Candidatus Syntrophosphaera sp.]